MVGFFTFFSFVSPPYLQNRRHRENTKLAFVLADYARWTPTHPGSVYEEDHNPIQLKKMQLIPISIPMMQAAASYFLYRYSEFYFHQQDEKPSPTWLATLLLRQYIP